MGRRKSRRHGRMIVVHAERGINSYHEFVKDDDDDEKKLIKESHPCEEFYIVNLKTNKIYDDRLPPLPRAQFYQYGHMVASGGSIFVFGSQPLAPSHLNKYAQTEKCDVHFYMGTSEIKFDHYNKKVAKGASWASAVARPNFYSDDFTCFNGDVYSFPVDCSPECPPEVLRFNKEVEQPEEHSRLWEVLLPMTELDSWSTTLPVMADPENNRFLVMLETGYPSSTLTSLYAFYPPKNDDSSSISTGGKWECLHSNFIYRGDDYEANCLLDGVIYLYLYSLPNLVHAYDAASGEELEVKWSKRGIAGEDLSVDDCIYKQFSYLLCLDDTNKILCLASHMSHMNDPDEFAPDEFPTIFFFTFKVKRCGTTITLTPLYTRSYELPSAVRVHNLLVL